jgi:hypothetical protein
VKSQRAFSGGERRFPIETDPSSDLEWLTVLLVPPPWPSIILDVVEDYTLSLTLRSNRRKDRGKTVFRIPEITVEAPSRQIVDNFEWTLLKSRFQDMPTPFQRESLRTKWMQLAHPRYVASEFAETKNKNKDN